MYMYIHIHRNMHTHGYIFFEARMVHKTMNVNCLSEIVSVCTVFPQTRRQTNTNCWSRVKMTWNGCARRWGSTERRLSSARRRKIGHGSETSYHTWVILPYNHDSLGSISADGQVLVVFLQVSEMSSNATICLRMVCQCNFSTSIIIYHFDVSKTGLDATRC